MLPSLLEFWVRIIEVIRRYRGVIIIDKGPLVQYNTENTSDIRYYMGALIDDDYISISNYNLNGKNMINNHDQAQFKANRFNDFFR